MIVIDCPCPKCLAEPGEPCAEGWVHKERYAVWKLCTLRYVSLRDCKLLWSQVEAAIKARENSYE